MNPSPEIPPVIGQPKSITYELTRGDIFFYWMTLAFRNRILQAFLVFAFVLKAYLVLSPNWGDSSLPELLMAALFFVSGYFGFLAVLFLAIALAYTFLPKHHGVLGKHVLEITDRGLIERTDYNEAVIRWPSVCRVLSQFGYLFIYVSEMNSYQIPKRYFSADQIDGFRSEIRQRMGKN